MPSTKIMASMAVGTVADIVHDYKLTTVEIEQLLKQLIEVAIAARTGASGEHVHNLKMELYGLADDMTDGRKLRRR